MDLFSLGQYLRDTREAKEITLEKAERDLRIRRRVLEAFEQGDFAFTDASPVQVRGFLRNYALYLGLDGERVLLLYDSALQNASRRRRRSRSRERPVPVDPLPSETRPPSQSRREAAERPTTRSRRGMFGRKRRTRKERRELREKRASQEIGTVGAPTQSMQDIGSFPPPGVVNPALTPVEFPAFQERPASRPRRDVTDTDPALPRITPLADDGADDGRLANLLNALFTIVVALAAIGVIVYVGLQIIDLPDTNAPEGVLGQLPQQPTFSLVPTLALIATPQPTAVVDTLGIAQQFDGAGVAVTMRLAQRTWLRVTTDGNLQINRLALPGEILEFRAQGLINLVASNAEALIVIYNGVPQSPFGGRGQQVEISFGTQSLDISTGPGFAPTPEFSPTPPPTQDPGAVATLLFQQTPTATEGPSPTPSDTPTITLTPSVTFTPQASPTPSSLPSATFTPLPSDTPGPTPTPTVTPPPTNTQPPTAPVPPRQGAPNPTPTKDGA